MLRSPGILDATGIPYTLIRDNSEFGKIGEVIDDAFAHSRPHVALVLPAAWEGPEFCWKGSPGPRPVTREITRHLSAGDP